MRKSFVALLLLIGAAAFSANLALAALDDPGNEGLKLQNAQMSKELMTRASRLGTSTGVSDTTWVGFTRGYFNAATNYWSIYAGFGKAGYERPGPALPPTTNGVWTFDDPAPDYWGGAGDSLQGWVPQRQVYNGTGGQTRNDRNRAWWAIDVGNTANYRINASTGRTFGVVGVWHVDGGSGVVQSPNPDNLPPPNWAPLQGTKSAWMGMRAHGDVTTSDPITGNPFNEDVLMYNQLTASRSSGNDKAFPGYGDHMDQMLYKDIDVLPANMTSAMTVSFLWQTEMSTGIQTAAAGRTGWFDKDPLGNPSGAVNNQLNNFISSTDAGDCCAPADSFMVYVGAPVLADQQWKGSDGALHSVYDPQRRWFAEVLHSDLDPASSPSDPQPLYYQEILTAAGVNAAQLSTITIPNSILQKIYAKSVNKVRLVFRVKTNRGFSDEFTTYSSNGRGAAIVDDVAITVGAQSVTQQFESGSAIDNTVGVDAWKSTGKPPALFEHVHSLDQLIYEDLCGQPGVETRICNMYHNVISAGDHDQSEAAGGIEDGSAERERFTGIFSPTIFLDCGPYDTNGKNPHGLYAPGGAPVPDVGAGDCEPWEDYYICYDMYTGIFDLYVGGNEWRFGCMSYPALSKPAYNAVSYPAWGQVRYCGFILFNPDKQCFWDWEGAYQNGLIKSSKGNGIPDSMKIMISKRQECYRFGVTTTCSPTDGCYWDNFTLAIIDGVPAQMTVDIWNWINDAFPANESTGYPGVAALFDTCGALIKTGFNIAPSPNTKTRYDIPGDSVIVVCSPTTARVDMIFRILPGPGDYQPRGDGSATGYIKSRPDLPDVPASRVTVGDGSFWDQYRQIPGDFATPNATALHMAHAGGWDPNVWMSARCDTMEANVYAYHGKGILGGPGDPYSYMTTYHESDPHFATLGILKNRCFIRCATCATTDWICDGTVPTDDLPGGYLPVGTPGTTIEETKIIPDGLLTCGAHVEYFFRNIEFSKENTDYSALLPDTNTVWQTAEGTTDGHRWQEFSVLPDCWKSGAYTHPVFQAVGRGPACMLVVDGNDRRGNERVWISVADTIGATEYRKWGAHNGWHAVGAGNAAPDLATDPVNLNNPGNNRYPKDWWGIGSCWRAAHPGVGFVAEHGGSPGTTWDLYQVKASESVTTGAGSIGSRLAYRGGNPEMYLQSSKAGPTPEMLAAYYKLMLYLSGDLNSGVLGPYRNKSQNDAGLIINWLLSGDPAIQNRGFWAMGDGFVEDCWNSSNPEQWALLGYLGVDLQNPSYTLQTGNTDNLVALRSIGAYQGKSRDEFFGVRSACT
jgi:hypothetical protein